MVIIVLCYNPTCKQGGIGFGVCMCVCVCARMGTKKNTIKQIMDNNTQICSDGLLLENEYASTDENSSDSV